MRIEQGDVDLVHAYNKARAAFENAPKGTEAEVVRRELLRAECFVALEALCGAANKVRAVEQQE